MRSYMNDIVCTCNCNIIINIIIYIFDRHQYIQCVRILHMIIYNICVHGLGLGLGLISLHVSLKNSI